VRSGEEQDRLRYEDVRWLAGEDRGGEEEGEGEQSLHKSTFPFLDPGKGGQGKGRVIATKGVRQGHKEQDGSPAVKSLTKSVEVLVLVTLYSLRRLKQ